MIYIVNHETELENIKLFLLDMDGTIYLGDRLIEGAREFITKLNKKNIKFTFFTNNSSWNIEHYVEKLKSFGIPVSRENIISSTSATIEYLNKNYMGKTVFPLGTELFTDELARSGISIDTENPDIVLLSFDRTLNYEKLVTANRFLLAGKTYLATNPDLVCPTPEGPIPDCGSMMALLEKSSGRRPEIIFGKPEPYMINIVRNKYGIPEENTAIVGDRLYTDMLMGKKAGITRILVFSGETKKDDDWKEKTDIAVDSVMDLAGYY